MANIDEMLKKHQGKIERAIGVTTPKKIDRSGEPTRPWHYSLDRFSKEKENEVAKTGKILENNWKKSGNKPGKELEINRKNTGNTEPEYWKNTGSQTGNDSGKELEINRKNTGNKTSKPSSFFTLTGLQRQMVDFFYAESMRTADKSTPGFRLEFLGEVFKKQSSKGLESIRKSIYALQKKRVISRQFSKHGPGGFTQYRLSDAIFNEVRDLEIWKNTGKELEINRKNTGSQTGIQTGNGAPSSSSKDLYLNKLTNTADTEVPVDLPSEWNEIDTSPLIAIRFGRPQLVQLVRLGTLTVEQVQESINAFSFDLEANGKGREINGHALNYFMGILRKGPYAPPSNYEPPEVRQMRLYLEAKERDQKIRVDLESRLETIEFDEWTAGLTAEDRTRLVPPTDFAKPGSPGHNVQLKQYFRENVWPKRLEKIQEGNKCQPS
jgi:hypothetical protein